MTFTNNLNHAGSNFECQGIMTSYTLLSGNLTGCILGANCLSKLFDGLSWIKCSVGEFIYEKSNQIKWSGRSRKINHIININRQEILGMSGAGLFFFSSPYRSVVNYPVAKNCKIDLLLPPLKADTFNDLLFMFHKAWYRVENFNKVLLRLQNISRMIPCWQSVERNYLSIPKLQRLHRWSLGMDK